MNRWTKLLRQNSRSGKPAICGMVHARALPGTPKSSMSVKQIIHKAVEEALIYKNNKLLKNWLQNMSVPIHFGTIRNYKDAVIVENMYDIPYVMSHDLGPEVTAVMTSICHEVRKACPELPLGVQILAGGNRQALATALASDFDFIRGECFVFSHVADEGIMNGCAGELLRYRKAIGAQHISIITDIKKKHSAHIITSDVSVEETAQAAEFFLADGVIVTGSSTGQPASRQDLQAVKDKVSIPVLVGSGVTPDNMSDFSAADALIVGSYFKHSGNWQNEIDEKKVQLTMNTRDQLTQIT